MSHVMNELQKMSDNHPCMIAWIKYKASEEYKNTILWAGENNRGCIFTAFYEGWIAAGGVL